MTRLLPCLGLLLASSVLSGCALEKKMRAMNLLADKTELQMQAQHDAFVRSVNSQHARRAAQKVNRPWLAGRATPLAREITLPRALRADVDTTLLFSDGAMDLPAVAQRITAVTSIPVHVRPDALLPLERFLPRLADTAQSVSTRSAPVTVMLSGGSEPLVQILDRVCARLGVRWAYKEDRIEFYRTETRVFNVRALTLNATSEATLGSRGNGKSEGFASSSQTRLSGGPHELLAVVRLRLEPFLSQAGLLVAEPGASSSIVVTDTPDVLQRIAQYLEQENRALTRRVRLVFEEITLIKRDTAEAGVDWNLVFSSAKTVAALTIPGSGAAEAAGLGLGITQGPFQGSEALIKALSRVGQIVRRSSMPVLTLNRRPVTHAVRTTFSYIDKVQTTAMASGTGMALPSVSVSQKDETVGSLLTLVPDAQANGQVLLSVAYDNTVAQPLKTVTFGDKNNPLQLQQVTIDGNGTVQQVILQPGQPMIISGFDRAQEEAEGRRLNPGIPIALGGSDRTSSQRLMTIIIVAAQVEEGF